MFEPRMGPRLSISDKRRFLKKDKEGVASTVGTIMALLVFLTFLSMFTNSYVPVWMQDNERAHMDEVVNQFGDLKGKIDNLIIAAQVTGSTSIHMYSPITLGAQGVPIFAAPTLGMLTYSPQGSGGSSVTVKFNYTLDGARTPVSVLGGGVVELYAPNRYYVQQWVAYENGAMLIRQPDGQTVRAYPSVEVEKIGPDVNVAFTQIDFLGSNASVGGSATVGLNVNLVYLDSQTYTVHNTSREVTITYITEYGDAWVQFLQDLCSKAGLDAGDYTIVKSAVNDDVDRVVFRIANAGTIDYHCAFVSVSVEV